VKTHITEPIVSGEANLGEKAYDVRGIMDSLREASANSALLEQARRCAGDYNDSAEGLLIFDIETRELVKQ
jgi:hypothetical protein